MGGLGRTSTRKMCTCKKIMNWFMQDDALHYIGWAPEQNFIHSKFQTVLVLADNHGVEIGWRHRQEESQGNSENSFPRKSLIVRRCHDGPQLFVSTGCLAQYPCLCLPYPLSQIWTY